MLCCLTATLYDRTLAAVEAGSLGALRADLLGGLRGDIVEVGSGTGVNLQHYPADAAVTLTEPGPHMRRRLARRLSEHTDRFTLLDAPAERLPMPDASVDAVVCTLVLCTVPDPAAALAEIRRVLRPSGRLVFIEHVAAEPETSAARWQRRLDPLWGLFSAGCRLTRPTGELMEGAGFSFDTLDRVALSPAPWFIRPAICGVARPARASG